MAQRELPTPGSLPLNRTTFAVAWPVAGFRSLLYLRQLGKGGFERFQPRREREVILADCTLEQRRDCVGFLPV
jgi:hypothetical protein